MKIRIWVSGLALGLSVFLVAPVLAGPAQDGRERERRAELAERLVEKWGDHVREAYPVSGADWEQAMLPLLLRLPSSTLQRAANAGSFDEMNQRLLQPLPVAPAPAPTPARGGTTGGATTAPMAEPKALGSTGSDLVYTPVPPCRLFDTRLAGGAIGAGTSRDFDVSSTGSYAPQGGSATDCGGTGSVGPLAAVAVTFTVVSPSNIGFLTAHAAGTTRPLAATMAYPGGVALASNTAIVPVAQGAGPNELTVYNNASAHVVADIVGYFIRPQATALDCTQTNVSSSVAANGNFDLALPACPAGYTITGAGCRTYGFNDADWAINGLFSPFPSGLAAYCSGRNKTANTIQVEGVARCCRVPGR